MNAIIVNDFAHVNGGAAQVALASARALAERGDRVTLFAAVGPVDASLRECGVEVVCTGQHEILRDPNRWRAAAQGLWNGAAAGRLAKLLEDFDPRETVIHLHGWTKALSSSVARAAVRRKYPVVLTLHDYFLACPNGGFLDYPRARPCGLDALSPRCLLRSCDGRRYAHKLWRVARQAVQLTAGMIPREIRNFIAVSDFSHDVLRPYLRSGDRVYRIDCPVEATRRAPVNPARNAPFVFVGRLAPEKGAAMLARCAREIGAPLTMIGDGPERAAVAAAYERAEITGWLPQSEVLERVKTGRALVFPSLWYETLGMAVLEAAAAGVPAIVSDCSAARDLVADGITGLWFRSGSAEHLAAQMRRAQSDEVVEHMGRAAYEQYWRSPYTLEKHVDQLQACYGQLLRAGTGASVLSCV